MQSVAQRSTVRSFTRSTVRPRVAARRAVKVCAKYGEQSRYFDLNDMENTTGSWDMYGTDDSKRYPGLQVEFFERAAVPLQRREALLGVVAASYISAIVIWGRFGSKDLNLPITKGSLTGGENGKGGSARAKL